MGYHAVLGPSGASRWTDCTASPGQCAGKPNESSAASRPGTALHQAGAECLEDGHDPGAYLGRVMGFPVEGEEGWLDELPHSALANIKHTYTVDTVGVNALRTYVDYVRDYMRRNGGKLLIERDVPIDHITGEAKATGRSDVIVLNPPLITVIDAKFGKKKVRAYDVVEEASVDPLTGEETPEKRRMNLQLAMYAEGALRGYGGADGYRVARAVIVQPMIDSISEFEWSTLELLDLTGWLYERAVATRENPEFKPTFDNCLFCAGKIDCPARAAALSSTYADGFEDVPDHVENADLF